MQRICAWCKKEIGVPQPASSRDDTPISHGICVECARKFLRLEIEPMRSYLDRFPGAVLLVDADARVITANQEGYKALQQDPASIDGQLGGDAIRCRHALFSGTCGQTVHCKTCTVRMAVTDTMQTGRSHVAVPAYMDLAQITGDKRIRFLITTEKMGEAVLLRIDEISDVDDILALME